MGDDLGTPAAVAAIHNLVREGYKLFAVGAFGRRPGAVRAAMLWVLGSTRWTSIGTQLVCTGGAAVHSTRHGPPMWNGVEPVVLTSVQVVSEQTGAGKFCDFASVQPRRRSTGIRDRPISHSREFSTWLTSRPPITSAISS